MPPIHRYALAVLALGVVAVTAHSVHAFFLVDACVGAGGRYLTDPPRCDVGGEVVRALGGFPKRRGWWAYVLVPSALAGALVFMLGRAMLRRVARS